MKTSYHCTVGLVDPVWVGHHATYFRAFIESFVEAGARVVALCPNPEDLEDLAQTYPDALVVGKLEHAGESRLLRGREHDPFVTQKRWRLASKSLAEIEAASGWKVDFVFFAWLDSYLRFMSSSGKADRLLGRPWTGLYFRNQHLTEEASGIIAKVKQRLKGDFIMRSENCRLISGVDERALPFVEAFARKPVLLMPDITDETAGDPEVPLAVTIREKAAGRKVIGIVGLEKRKGCLTLMRVAREAEKQGKPLFFAFTGVLWWDTFSDDEVAWIKEFLANPPGNIHLDSDAGMVPDGAVYNGIALTFDVFFAAYLNSLYNGSSNVLTKGALLKLPTIVTEGACLEDRVKAYRLGLAVPEDDVERCMDAIERLLKGVNWDGIPLDPRYSDYFALHSHQRLIEHAREMISTAMAG
ncbi:MAG: hypothetical protein ACI8T1_001050 [Verrucomicrobiales bacterium]|jgi:hypothetical protein